MHIIEKVYYFFYEKADLHFMWPSHLHAPRPPYMNNYNNKNAFITVKYNVQNKEEEKSLGGKSESVVTKGLELALGVSVT